MLGPPMTVIESHAFLVSAERIMSEQARSDLVMFVAANPEAGDIIPETGGVRKLRWALEGRGKRGGARAIYYFHSGELPVVMLNIFPKNVKPNLSQAERNALRKLMPELVRSIQQWRKK